MPRAAAWTVGLFGAGAALARAFSAAWLEPVVLLALGIAFLFVSSRSRVRHARAGARTERAAVVPGPAALDAGRVPSAAAAPVVVEESL